MEYARHKLTGERMKVKKHGEKISVLYLPEPITTKFDTVVTICVCLNKNLVFEQSQLSLI